MTEKLKIPPFEILILSCDAFSDIWEINGAFLKQNWKESLRNASLVTETSEPDFAPPIRIVHTGKQVYADKVQLALEEIQSPYVILLLDDYLLTKRIDQKEIESVLLEAAENNADYIRFDRFRGEKKKKGSQQSLFNASIGQSPLSSKHGAVPLENVIIKEDASRPKNRMGIRGLINGRSKKMRFAVLFN